MHHFNWCKVSELLLLYFDYLNSLLLICWTTIKLRGSENRASVEVKRAWKKGRDFTRKTNRGIIPSFLTLLCSQ